MDGISEIKYDTYFHYLITLVTLNAITDVFSEFSLYNRAKNFINKFEDRICSNKLIEYFTISSLLNNKTFHLSIDIRNTGIHKAMHFCSHKIKFKDLARCRARYLCRAAGVYHSIQTISGQAGCGHCRHNIWGYKNVCIANTIVPAVEILKMLCDWSLATRQQPEYQRNNSQIDNRISAAVCTLKEIQTFWQSA